MSELASLIEEFEADPEMAQHLAEQRRALQSWLSLEAQLAAAREHVHRSTGQRVRWAKVWIAALAAAAQERIRKL